MANYAASKPGHTEAALTARTPDAAGDAWENDGSTMFFFTNSSGTNSYTVTFVHGDHCSHGFGHDVPVTVGTSLTTMAQAICVGPFPTARFNDANGRVAVTYTGTAPATDLRVYAVSTGGTVTGVA